VLLGLADTGTGRRDALRHVRCRSVDDDVDA